jgi:hypothetical protein
MAVEGEGTTTHNDARGADRYDGGLASTWCAGGLQIPALEEKAW